MNYAEYKSISEKLNKDTAVTVNNFFNQKDAAQLTDLYVIAKQSYWNGTAIMEDWVYDILCSFMKTKAPSAMEVVEHGSQTGLPYSKKVKHDKPMLSLNKVYSEDDLFDWVKSVSRTENEEFLIQPKYDGVSCYYDGAKDQYSTRGDGYEGEDISVTMMALGCIDHSAETNPYNILGEIVIKKSDFNTLYKNIRNASGENFKNSRNAIAGILGTDDVEFYKKQGAVIHLVDYDLYSFKAKSNNFEQSFQIAKQIISNLDYPMDGIVVKLANKKYSEFLGYTAHHPKGQIAFKFQNSNAWTTLQNIEFGMGKGQITATAVFKTVNLGGVSISRAVIPMYSETLPCVKKGNFSVGSELLVERAGDVIPHIIEVKKSVGPVFDIENCPFCGSPIKIVGSSVVCENEFCREKLIQKLYLALVTLGVKDIGEKTVRDVVSALGWKEEEITLANWIEAIKSHDFVKKMANTPGYTAYSGGMIVKVTEKQLDSSIDKFVAALNIPNVGVRIGKELAKIGDIEKMVNIDIATLTAMNCIGDTLANRIYDYFGKNKNEILRLAGMFNFGTTANKTVKTNGNAISGNGNGRTVCFTGAMRYQRSEMSKIATDRGFVPVASVTKDTDILVLADCESGTSSKCQKARKYGIEIIRENDFLSGNF